MRSATPKVLHDLCGRPDDRLARRRRPRGRGGPRRRRRRARPGARRRACPTGVETRRAADAPTAPAARSPPRREHLRRRARSLVVNGDVPLVTGAAIARARATPTPRPAPRRPLATMVLDDPTGYGRVVRAADGSRRARGRDQGARATRRPRSSPSARSTPASTPSTPPRCAARSTGCGTDNAQGELYLPDVLRAPARRRRGASRAHVVDDPDARCSASTTASSSPTSARSRSAGSIEAHQRAGVTIVDPASTVIEAGVRASAPTPSSSPSTFLRGDDRSAGERCVWAR